MSEALVGIMAVSSLWSGSFPSVLLSAASRPGDEPGRSLTDETGDLPAADVVAAHSSSPDEA